MMIARYQRDFMVSAIVFLFDRLTKYLAYRMLQVADVFVFKWCSFSLTYNTGIAWSLLADKGYFVEGLIVIATLYFLYQLWLHAQDRALYGYPILGELLVIVGGLSNLCDRCLYFGVLDFIKISGYGYTFPLFNIADVSVCTGIVIILYDFFIREM